MKKNPKFDLNHFLKKYRSTNNFKDKSKLLSKISKKNRILVFNSFTKKEVEAYKKYTSALVEKRFDAVRRNRNCLEALLSTSIDDIDINEIKKKYSKVDLSISIYSMKAIINVYEGSSFSDDDYIYTENTKKYYRTCKYYWERIFWDTDTGHLSKEDIRKKKFTQYHLEANKMKTIIKCLEDRKLQIKETKLKQLIYSYYHTNIEGVKSYVGGYDSFQYFCDREYNILINKGYSDDDFFTYTDVLGKNHFKLTKANYNFLIERDKELKKSMA